jgi:endonuclease III
MKHKSNEIDKVYEILKHEFQKHRMPVVDLIETQTKDPFKVLLTTIMSARTKDETTILAAKRLFQRVSTPADLDSLSVKEIESLIFPVGFIARKQKTLKNFLRFSMIYLQVRSLPPLMNWCSYRV